MNIRETNIRYWSVFLFLFVLIWFAFYFYFANQPKELFIKNWPYIFLGFGGALLGNLSSVGGGIIFIPAMMFVFRHPPLVALKVALLSQCFGMTSGAISWLQKQKIPLYLFTLTVPPMILGSTVSSLVIHPSALLVKLFFGPVSVILGALVFSTTRRKNKSSQSELTLPFSGKILLGITSFFGGLITGWVAIGEGEIVSAFLMLFYDAGATLSIATGVVLLSINSLYLASIHHFHLGGLPWEIACFTGFGCVFGARLAPFMAQKFDPKVLKYIFSIIAIADGLLFVFQYFWSRH